MQPQPGSRRVSAVTGGQAGSRRYRRSVNKAESAPPEWSVEETRRLLRYAERDGYVAAELRLLQLSEGGRRHPVYSGWVAAWNLGGPRDGQRPDTNAAIVIADGALNPGDTAAVRIFPTGFAWRDVQPRQRVELLDGRTVIGTAEVIEHVGGTGTLPGRWPCYAVVRLKSDGDGLPAGATGVIVRVYEDAYEVEVEDSDGSTLGVEVVTDDLLELVEERSGRDRG